MSAKAIAVFVNGSMFLLQDVQFTDEQIKNLEKIAGKVLVDHPGLIEKTHEEIFCWFVKHASKKLDICLKPVDISVVIGIK